MNGTHRRDGIWIDARSDLSAAPAGLAHAAAAIANIMGLAWAEDATHGEPLPPRQDYSSQEEAVVAERLRALGYLE